MTWYGTVCRMRAAFYDAAGSGVKPPVATGLQGDMIRISSAGRGQNARDRRHMACRRQAWSKRLRAWRILARRHRDSVPYAPPDAAATTCGLFRRTTRCSSGYWRPADLSMNLHANGMQQKEEGGGGGNAVARRRGWEAGRRGGGRGGRSFNVLLLPHLSMPALPRTQWHAQPSFLDMTMATLEREGRARASYYLVANRCFLSFKPYSFPASTIFYLPLPSCFP